MAKSSVEAYGAEGKVTTLAFDPEKLVLVEDNTHPLYDDRVHKPVDEMLVRNIMHQGVLQAVVVCKNTETGAIEVVAGRQRVKACREANKRLLAQGLAPHQIPAMVRRAAGADLAGVMVSENELRSATTPMDRAAKMTQLINLGKSEEQICVLFGCTAQTVRNTLALLECTAAVRNAVEAGKVGVSHAMKLAKLPPAEQREKLAQLLEAGSGDDKPHEKAKKQRAVVDAGPKMRTKKEVTGALEDETNPVVKACLNWVLGQREELPE